MKVLIEINCDNSAFENFEYELSRILDKLAKDVEQEYWHDGKELYDFNGHKVGQMKVEN